MFFPQFTFGIDPNDPNRLVIGANLVPVSSKINSIFLKQGVKLPRPNGLLVTSVVGDGPAFQANIQVSDLIYKVNGKYVANMNDWQRMMKQVPRDTPIHIELFRATEVRNQVVWEKHYPEVVPTITANLSDTINMCPVKIIKATIHTNTIDEPVLNLSVFNCSKQPVTAFKASIFCYNRFDEPVMGLDGSNCQSVICQDTIAPDTESTRSSTLHYRDTTGKAKVEITRIKFKDGSEWNADPNNRAVYIFESKE